MDNPIIKAVVSVYNPLWTQPTDAFLINQEREVEVVQLNINAHTMRVRFKDTNQQGKTGVRTQDVSADAFYAQYEITPK